MKVFYVFVIGSSVFFNSLVQSYAFSLWQSGVPIGAFIQARGADHVFLAMNPSELSEVEI